LSPAEAANNKHTVEPQTLFSGVAQTGQIFETDSIQFCWRAALCRRVQYCFSGTESGSPFKTARRDGEACVKIRAGDAQ